MVDYPAALVSCHDGDTCTFDVQLADTSAALSAGITQRTVTTIHAVSVRLCDINAPELGQPKADESRDMLTATIRRASEVVLRVPQSCATPERNCNAHDKYGRLLAWVIADGVDLNAQQVAAGLAGRYLQCARKI